MASRNNNSNNKRAIREVQRATLKREAEAIRKSSRDVLTPIGSNYMRCVVDPESAKPVGVPTLIGGTPGKTRVLKSQMTRTFSVGTGGFGYVMANPGIGENIAGSTQTYGGFQGNYIAAFTGATFAPTTVVNSAAGLDYEAYTSEYSSTTQANLSFRPVACSIEVFPTSSIMDQNGTLMLVETPGHGTIHAVTQGTLTQHPATRILQATRLAEKGNRILVNWHPSAGGTLLESDFSFLETTSASDHVTSGIGVLVTGTPGTTYRFTLTVIYEYRGLLVKGGKPRMTDSRSMDLINNVFAQKLKAGWVGDPNEIFHHYQAMAVKSGVKWGFLKEVPKALGSALKGDWMSLARQAAGFL